MIDGLFSKLGSFNLKMCLIQFSLLSLFIIPATFWVITIQKDNANITKWDGKSPLGNPDLIKIVDNFSFNKESEDVPEDFYRPMGYREIKRFCDPAKIDSFCIELYHGNLNRVLQTEKRAILQYSTGAILIVPIKIKNEERVVMSQRAESKKAWEILDEIPQTVFSIPGPNSMSNMAEGI